VSELAGEGVWCEAETVNWRGGRDFGEFRNKLGNNKKMPASEAGFYFCKKYQVN